MDEPVRYYAPAWRDYDNVTGVTRRLDRSCARPSRLPSSAS